MNYLLLVFPRNIFLAGKLSRLEQEGWLDWKLKLAITGLITPGDRGGWLKLRITEENEISDREGN